jgi:hypothetical protein
MHRGTSNIIVSNFVLMGAVILLLRRWRPPFGSVTLFLTVTTVLMAAVTGFLLPSLLLVPVAGGLAADTLIQLLRPSSDRAVALRVVAAVTPLTLWGSYFLVAHVLWRVAWPPEVWSGVVMWASASGLALSLLSVPSPATA